MASHIAEMNGLAVEAADGAGARDLLGNRLFDLAIVDLAVPDADGFMLIHFMRGAPRTKHLPIVIVAERDDREAIENAFAAGASSFLTKPLDWATFDHHIGYLLRLTHAVRHARANAHEAAAISRAKEAILGNVCGEASSTAAAVLGEIEDLWHSLTAKGMPAEVADSLRRIARETNTLRHLAIRASDMVAAISQTIAVDDGRVSLETIFTSLLGAAEPVAELAGIGLEFALPEGDIVIACDAAAIEMALMQLIQNAVSHSSARQPVSVVARVYPDGLLSIEVTDHGPGMHPDFVARCLNPLHTRNERMKRGADRIGFGLPLAKAIAEAHNGALEIRSMPGQGTTAMLALPADRIAYSPSAELNGAN